MPLKSFNNLIDVPNVSLAIEQILIAPSSQGWTPGRIDLDTPPTGFINLGAVVEDQVTLTFTREIFQLETGIPRVLQYSAVTGLRGRLEAQFHTISNTVMAYILSNVDPRSITGGTGVAFGTSKQKEWHILGVADCIDGQQVVHDMQKARAGGGDMQDAFRPTQNGRIQGRWELFGYESTDYGADTELIVMERFYFPTTATATST